MLVSDTCFVAALFEQSTRASVRRIEAQQAERTAPWSGLGDCRRELGEVDGARRCGHDLVCPSG